MKVEFESKPLAWWMKNFHEMSREIWLWIPSETKALTPETICYIVDEDIDLSVEEQDQRDVLLEGSGLSCLFCKDQLEDILLNLEAQKKDYADSDLYFALNFYWKRDAFINLDNV
ncbi:hypothetical protein O5O45_07655 [Hahella aquimaris]|uniref:DUF7716 domain-containing protein n=1 Tax=Hahella sp. HNIBRBA332 TaxID=3015983 RepID=UPI00273C6A68|nr:hypothetical protein [Hahella sp. HNIBRBA332]WLQ15786.1 hypothetical protein O5O45_07655 [Hahella sp. HNIBRBA332]